MLANIETGFSRILDSWMRGFHFALPGIVTGFTDRNVPRISVQPAFMRVMSDNESVPVTLPLLEDVPVIFPGGGDFLLTFDLTLGSCVLLIVAQRALDTWMQTGSTADPVLNRMLDLSDAIAIPGLVPLPGTLPIPIDADKIVLRKKDGTASISIASNNEIVLTNPTGSITIKATGQVDINGNLTVDP